MLPEDVRIRIANEFRYAVEQMRSADDPHSKLYYYSALFGEIQRVLNVHWDRDLVLIHSVVSTSHNQIGLMTQNIVTGGERAIKLSSEFFDALTNAVGDLAEHFDAGEDASKLYSLLGRLAELGYASTGNGWYLLGKGRISL